MNQIALLYSVIFLFLCAFILVWILVDRAKAEEEARERRSKAEDIPRSILLDIRQEIGILKNDLSTQYYTRTAAHLEFLGVLETRLDVYLAMMDEEWL